MEKIKPKPRKGFLIRKRKIEEAEVISEVGFYSFFIK